MNQKKVLVLQHRDELVDQNRQKFRSFTKNRFSTSLFTRFEKDWSGQVVFSMVQTLSRKKHLETMPPIDFMVIDEGHHAVSKTYKEIINRAKELNPKLKISGWTATPNRGDKIGLGKAFEDLAAQILLSDLVHKGYLVPPTAYAIEIDGLKKKLMALKRQRVVSMIWMRLKIFSIMALSARKLSGIGGKKHPIEKLSLFARPLSMPKTYPTNLMKLV